MDVAKKGIFVLTITILVISCGPRTGISNKQAEPIIDPATPDPNQIRYVENIIAVGQKVFKENCIACHCGPTAHVEPPYTCKLQYAFDRLPLDSLTHFETFLKNSSRTKKSSRKNPFLTDEPNEENYIHAFEKTLSDSLIKAVIEYLWIGYKRID